MNTITSSILPHNDYLVCIMGKSGSGKDTLVNLACGVPLFSSKNDDSREPIYLKPLISYTTRPRRKGEKDTHIFVEPESKPDMSCMMAYTKYNNYEYWSTYDQVKDANLYIIDPQGVQYLKRLSQKTHVLAKPLFIIYLKTSWKDRLKRLTRRNNFWYAIKRIWNDRTAFKDAEKYADVVLSQNKRTDLHRNCNFILKMFEVPQVSEFTKLSQKHEDHTKNISS